jgi:glutaredoxin-related protein
METDKTGESMKLNKMAELITGEFVLLLKGSSNYPACSFNGKDTVTLDWNQVTKLKKELEKNHSHSNYEIYRLVL